MQTKILIIGLTLKWNSVSIETLMCVKTSVVQMLFIWYVLGVRWQREEIVFIYLKTVLQTAILNLILIKNNR